MAEFLMPSLGSDMETGTLIEWQKKPGDTVTRGDIIAVVETQKGAIEIEVFDSGVLETQLVDIGKPVPVGTPLALIRTLDQAGSSTPVATSEAHPKLHPKRPVVEATIRSGFRDETGTTIPEGKT